MATYLNKLQTKNKQIIFRSFVILYTYLISSRVLSLAHVPTPPLSHPLLSRRPLSLIVLSLIVLPLIVLIFFLSLFLSLSLSLFLSHPLSIFMYDHQPLQLMVFLVQLEMDVLLYLIPIYQVVKHDHLKIIKINILMFLLTKMIPFYLYMSQVV